jgi:hypothetical protein
LENDTTRKPPPGEEHLNLEETNTFADTVELVDDTTMFDAEQATYHRDKLHRRTAHPILYAAGHWQEDEAQDGDADGDYYQTFKVDEDHDTSLTPEKKQFKSNEVDSPDVRGIPHQATPPTKNVLRINTMRKHLRMCGVKTGLGMPRWMNDKNLLFIQGVVFIPLQKSGKGRQLDTPVDNANSLWCHLCCDLCCRSGTMAIRIPNSLYEHRLRLSSDWYDVNFIAGFAALLQHDAHISIPNYKSSDRLMMVFTPYPNKPVNEILPYGKMTHFVPVVCNRLHFAVLNYDIDEHTVTVFDGLNQKIIKWQDHFILTVKTYGLKPQFSSATCKF